MVSADKAVVCILQVWLKGDDSLLSNFSDLLCEVADIFACFLQGLYYVCIKLLRAVVIVMKLICWCFESLTVFVQ